MGTNYRAQHGWPPLLPRRQRIAMGSPTMRTPFPQTLLAALTYLRALLASTYPSHWARLKRSTKTTPLWDLSIAPRWRQILNEEWTSIPHTPSPMTLDRATQQHSLQSALARHPRDLIEGKAVHPPKLTLHFPTPRKRRADRKKQTSNAK